MQAMASACGSLLLEVSKTLPRGYCVTALPRSACFQLRVVWCNQPGCACNLSELPVLGRRTLVLSASTPELYSRGNLDCAACREKDMQGMLGRLLSLTRCMSRHPGASTDSISVMWRSNWASVKMQAAGMVLVPQATPCSRHSALTTALQGQLETA